MRRPPYSRKVMRGILLIYKKMNINFDHGYLPSLWTRRDINDAKRALGWLGDFYDWTEDKGEEKEAAEKALDELFPDGVGEVEVVEGEL